MKGIHRMTDTEQLSATPAEASADDHKTIRAARIKAIAEAVHARRQLAAGDQ
jgi:hypothetical protein